MKNGFAPGLLAASLALSAMSSPAASLRGDAVRVHGTDYVGLADWSRVKGLKWRWLKRDESFQLTNATVRFQFAVDSREARFNGLQLWLLFPLATRNGEILISRLDADNTLRPLLAPPRNGPDKKIKTICLDPGHGGKDSGNRVASKQEKDFTLRLAFELRDQLRKAGFQVYLTRSGDTFVELFDRNAVARSRNADLFVSLHFNATDGGRNEAKGAEVYALTPAGASSTNARGEGKGGWATGNKFNANNLLLACQIQKSLVRNLEVEDRGVRRARFAVLRDAAMPAVLIEAGFMSHPTEGKKIFDAAYRREMARAIVDGIGSYKRIVER
ncbi:MAG: N-acetylmuramoyl-L-alanine amidase [Verrucomicrobiota bacterium]